MIIADGSRCRSSAWVSGRSCLLRQLSVAAGEIDRLIKLMNSNNRQSNTPRRSFLFV